MSLTASSGNRIVIDAWLHYYKTPVFMDPMRDAVAKFEAAHPEYEIRLHEDDYTKMPTAIAQAVAQGETPTIAQYYSTLSRTVFDMVTNDGTPLYTSVEKAIAGRTEILGEPVVRDFPRAAPRYYRTHDGFDAVPSLLSTTVLYSNMTILEAAGVSKVPETWAELEAACRAVANLTDGPSHGITWSNHGWMFMQAAACQGALLVGNDNGRRGPAERTNLDSDELRAYLDWWQRLQRDGHYLYTGVQMDWPGAFGAFAEQQVAFLITSSVDARRLAQIGRDRGFELVTSRLPYNQDVPYVGNILGGDAIFLGNGLDEATQDGALAFLQFVNNPENSVARHKHTNYLPMTDATAARLEEENWFAEHPYQKLGREQLDESALTPAAIGGMVGELPRMQDTLTRAMHDVIVYGVDSGARLAEANREAQQLLDNYNAHRGPGRDLASYRVH